MAVDGVGEVSEALVGAAAVGVAGEELDEAGVGGIVEHAAEAQLFGGEGLVVVVQGGLDGVVLGVVGLEDNSAGAVAAAGAAGELDEEVVGALDGAEVGEAEIGVGGEHAGEGDVGEMVAFGDHLGADEDLGAAGAESLQHRRGAAGAAHGVAVEDVHRDPREHLAELLLQPLGAGADGVQGVALAAGADAGSRHGGTAVMADQLVLFAVVGAGEAAVVAAEIFAAGAAQQHRGIASAVAQQDHLGALPHRRLDLLAQVDGEDHLPRLAGHVFLLQVDENRIRQGAVAGAGGEGEAAEALALGVEAGFEAGGGGDQQHGGVGVAGPHQGEVAAVVARGDVLLVGGVLLLVHHHQAEIPHRGEDGGAGAEDHPGVAGADALPLLAALAGAEAGVQQGQLVAEALAHGAGEGGHEGDLRYQQDGGAILGQGGLHRP